jgi:hypothetical protein
MRRLIICKPSLIPLVISVVVIIILVGSLISSPFATSNVFAQQPVLKFVTASASNETSTQEQAGGGIVITPGPHGGVVIPEDEVGGIGTQPENYTVIRPHECKSYELFSEPTLKAMTCAQIVLYPATNRIAAFAQQWVEGNKVYDDVIPKDVVELPCPNPPTPCRLVNEEYQPQVYKGMVGNYQVTLSLRFSPDNERLDLSYHRCEITPTNSRICEPSSILYLFTWHSSISEWFSINIDAKDIVVEVIHDERDTNYIENLKQSLRQDLEENIMKTLESRGIRVSSYNQTGGIQINFTKY